MSSMPKVPPEVAAAYTSIERELDPYKDDMIKMSNHSLEARC
jgi:hypothetical protein